MPLTDMAARAVADKMPKVIDAKTHAFLDYAMAGAFLLLGAVCWKRNQRAAIGAVLCGGATVATSMLTDYPGGVKKLISFETHGKIDLGLTGLTATMPAFLAFGDEDEAKYFRGMALAGTLVAGLTDFRSGPAKVIEMQHRA